MPFEPDIGCKDYETFKAEFAERIIEKWAKYAPNMTRKNIIAQHVYTAQRIHRRPSRRCATATSSWARSAPSR